MDRSPECIHQQHFHRLAAELFAQPLSAFLACFFLHRFEIYLHVSRATCLQPLSFWCRCSAVAGRGPVLFCARLPVGRKHCDGGVSGHGGAGAFRFQGRAHSAHSQLSGFLRACDTPSRLSHSVACACRSADPGGAHVPALLSLHVLHDDRPKDVAVWDTCAGFAGACDCDRGSMAAHTSIAEHDFLSALPGQCGAPSVAAWPGILSQRAGPLPPLALGMVFDAARGGSFPFDGPLCYPRREYSFPIPIATRVSVCVRALLPFSDPLP